MKYIYIIFSIFFIFGCSTHHNIYDKEHITDLKNIPQDIRVYTQKLNYKPFNESSFKEKYFRVWNIDKISIPLSDAKWAFKSYSPKNAYGENLQVVTQNFFDDNLENSNFKEYASKNIRAISLKELNIRAFPSDRPLLLDPSKAGEGFPFDYLQNSTIAANKPLLISHYSKNREWVFIECSFTYGWVKSSDVMSVDKKYADRWQNSEHIFTTKEGVSVYSKDEIFLFKSRIGMMLPLVSEDESSYKVLTAFNTESLLSKKIAHKGILTFNTKNINKIINEVSKTNYGWGGMYSQRDCSSMLRDFFTPFAMWLPRNSYSQSRVGKVISLKNRSDAEKIAMIKENAVAFKTLLYKKGHIVLYVGLFNEEVIVFQNTWGIKTKKDGVEGRFIIGKPIFSTLRVGKNLKYHDEDALFIKKLKSMSTL